MAVQTIVDNRILELIRVLMEKAGCARFSELKKEVNLHSQTLSNLLKKMYNMGLVKKCQELGLKQDGYLLLIPYSFLTICQKALLEPVKLKEKCVVVKHIIHNQILNNTIMPFNKVLVKIYGDVVWDYPVILRTDKIEEKKVLDKSKDCPNNVCNIVFNLNKKVKPGTAVWYEWEYYGCYFPPRDYFTLEIYAQTIEVEIKIETLLDARKLIYVSKPEIIGCVTGIIKKKYMKSNKVVIRIADLSPHCVIHLPLKVIMQNQ